MHRATASIGEWRSVPASVALNEYRIGEEESAGEVTKMDNPGAGLGAVRDELAAPDRLPSVRGSHPSTSLWECRVVQHSKIGRSMSAGGHNRRLPHRNIYIRFTSVSRHKSPPKILELIHGHFAIADGVLDVLMTEVMLQRASIAAIVRKLVPQACRRMCGWMRIRWSCGGAGYPCSSKVSRAVPPIRARSGRLAHCG